MSIQPVMPNGLPSSSARPAAIPSVSTGIDSNPARFLRGNSDDFLSPNRILGKVDDFVQGFPTVTSGTLVNLMNDPLTSHSKSKEILKSTHKGINAILSSDFGAEFLPQSPGVPLTGTALNAFSPDIGTFPSPSSPDLSSGVPFPLTAPFGASPPLGGQPAISSAASLSSDPEMFTRMLSGLSGISGSQSPDMGMFGNMLSSLMPSGGGSFNPASVMSSLAASPFGASPPLGGQPALSSAASLSPDMGMFTRMLSGLSGASGSQSPDMGMFGNMLSSLMPSGGAGGLSSDAGMFANALSGLQPFDGATTAQGGLLSGSVPSSGGGFFPPGGALFSPGSALLQSQATVFSELTRKPSPSLIRDLANFNPLIWQNPSSTNVMFGSMDVQNKIFGGNGLFTPPGFNAYPLYPFITPPPVPFNGYNIPVPNDNGIRTLQQAQIFPTTFLTDSPFFLTHIRPFAVALSQTVTPFPSFVGLVNQLWPPNGVPPWI